MSSRKRKSKNIHAGSSFDEFLKEEDIFEHCQEVGAKYAFVMQLQDEMEKQQLTKEEFAKRIGTSRSALNRLLDPSQPSNLRSLINAASAVGKHLRISII
ncbi:MAG: helix-turn-helix domain-containing protein [Silvanigrellaceae bacterium]|nr:helix-turn-helix domain-containing protein [Silvanigrellaceae bacterium]